MLAGFRLQASNEVVNCRAGSISSTSDQLPTSFAQLSSALSAHITSLLVRLVANARHRSDGGGRRVADLEYEQDVRVAIGVIQRDAKREADQCAVTPLLHHACVSSK